MKLSLEQEYMLSVLHSRYHACWWSGDFRSQSINMHGIDPKSRNIPSPASEELMLLLRGVCYELSLPRCAIKRCRVNIVMICWMCSTHLWWRIESNVILNSFVGIGIHWINSLDILKMIFQRLALNYIKIVSIEVLSTYHDVVEGKLWLGLLIANFFCLDLTFVLNLFRKHIMYVYVWLYSQVPL